MSGDLLRLGNAVLAASCGGTGMFFLFESFRAGAAALPALVFLSLAAALHFCVARR